MSEEDEEERDENRRSTLPGAAFTTALQNASEEALGQQAELFDQFLRGGFRGEGGQSGAGFTDRLAGFGSEVGAFKTRVQTSGRVSIPDTERDALGIGEGDLVQVFVVPVEPKEKDKEQQ